VKIPVGKRILDVVLVILTSPVWLPLMLLLSMWVFFVSRGPIFFRQERVGYRGRKFCCFKFRSMKVNADTQVHEGYFQQLMEQERPMTKLDAAGDPRLIRGGKLFRASGLDELPQIFNVLRGEMSLVGPRPCTPQEFNHYRPWQKERVNGLPGLTGYWQTNGKNNTTFTEMITMDIYYVRNHSVRWDCVIMLKTFPALWAQIWKARFGASAQHRGVTVCETA
jgi:lipopolysaccharide/colanic/teichoic acid biosynthesis glycosyltransferase